MGQWFEVSEHIPQEDKIVLGYSEVYGEYILCKWTATRGWLSQRDDHLPIITHWCDLELPLNFEVTGRANEEIAKKHHLIDEYGRFKH